MNLSMKPLMLGGMLILAGCATITSGTNRVACRVFEPIRASTIDTVETKKQVIVHNAKWDKLCGG